MDEISKTDRCAKCDQEITFEQAEVDLLKHGRKIKGWMAICSKCGNTHFDSETTRVLIELGYVQKVGKNSTNTRKSDEVAGGQ